MGLASNSPPLPAANMMTPDAVDSLTCQWGDCRERCTSPETLYDHVCERHVGRKSTNNLNLTCQWGACHTTTVKRDHITSHIRVHVPLKPHKCEFCGKAFKRPQDLKKHVKTHADESVILRSPDQNASVPRNAMNNGYGVNGTKHNGYMADNSSYNAASYGHYQAPSHGFYGHAAAATTHAPGFGQVYYNVPQTVSMAAGTGMPGFDARKGHDSLNHFFRDVKNNEIDPGQYYDLGQRLGNVSNLGLPMFNGMQNGYPGPMDLGMQQGGVGTAVAYAAPAHPQMAYGMPFSELKTKNDLMSIDQFLQQLQETVYEHPESTGSPTASTVSSNMHMSVGGASQMRHSSDASLHVPHTGSPAVHTPGASSMTSDTPALTPSSYSSNSPVAMHSSHIISTPPMPQHQQHQHQQQQQQRSQIPNGHLYPQLPSLSSLHDSPSQNQYPVTTGAPAPGLGNAFDEYDGRRRYSLGYLQRAQPAPQTLHRESLERSGKAVSAAKAPAPAEPGEFQRRESDSKSDRSDTSSDDGRQEAWVHNMRIIEALRKFVKARLDKHEYADAAPASATSPAKYRPNEVRDQEMPDAPASVPSKSASPVASSSSLYPILRPIQD